MKEDFLFVEKYRPATLDDCILPDSIKKVFRGFLDSGEVPHLLLSGTPGTGKTTIAKALCKELDKDVLYLNCSESGGLIETLRTTIRNYASSVSLVDNGKKIIIMDEFDNATGAFQLGFRGFVEEFSDNVSFVLTCNHVHKVIPAIQSRCHSIEFGINKAQKPQLMNQLLKRIIFILDKENIQYDKKIIALLIKKHFPDFRKTLNELQKFSYAGAIDSSILSDASGDIDAFVGYIKDKNFGKIREFVETSNIEADSLFNDIFQLLLKKLDNGSIPQMVVIINEHQYKSAFVANKNINLLCCAVELMMECVFKDY